jgi:hypothetical protein
LTVSPCTHGARSVSTALCRMDTGKAPGVGATVAAFSGTGGAGISTASVGVAVGDAVGDVVGEKVGAGVGDTVGDEVGAAVGAAVGDAVGDEVGEGVGAAVGDAVGTLMHCVCAVCPTVHVPTEQL